MAQCVLMLNIRVHWIISHDGPVWLIELHPMVAKCVLLLNIITNWIISHDGPVWLIELHPMMAQCVLVAQCGWLNYPPWWPSVVYCGDGIKPGFRIHHILTCGSGSFGNGSNWKCIKIQNVKAGILSTTLPIMEFHHYKENYNKTGK